MTKHGPGELVQIKHILKDVSEYAGAITEIQSMSQVDDKVSYSLRGVFGEIFDEKCLIFLKEPLCPSWLSRQRDLRRIAKVNTTNEGLGLLESSYDAYLATRFNITCMSEE